MAVALDQSWWSRCIELLATECFDHDAPLSSKEINTWIRPLQADRHGQEIFLYAPNAFVQDWVKEKFFDRLEKALALLFDGDAPLLRLRLGSKPRMAIESQPQAVLAPAPVVSSGTSAVQEAQHLSHLNRNFTFDCFVEGKSNALAKAAAHQIGWNPGGAYNPFLIYGVVGVGKTHLMHAVGNQILANQPSAKVLYLHSERFVADMVKALQTNRMNDFKRYYRSLDALLIDDIQFFAGKDRSQEEFFLTFNALLEGNKQLVMTCDRYPKEIDALEERLKSRFGWGLTVAIEPPELETRVAILMSKAEHIGASLPHEVAFFIAKRISSNVRELEGALKRVVAYAHFVGHPISMELVKDALKDLLSLQDKMVSVENIQKTVAEYFKIKVPDLMSKRRNRSVARPRQVAMCMTKELTQYSLSEIGDAFGGRDHTTVLHAIRAVKVLREESSEFDHDYSTLIRILTS